MAFQLNGLTRIRALPSDGSQILVPQGGSLYCSGKTATDEKGQDWINVYIPPGIVDGWVRAADGATVPDPAPAPLDPEMFVRQCTLADRSMNADPAASPNFVAADFLIARALLETSLISASFSLPYLTGPLRLSRGEWDDFLASGFAVAKIFKAADAVFPMVQVYAAGHAMHAAGAAFAAAWSANDPTAARSFVPSYLDLFLAYLTDAATAVAVRRAEADATIPLSGIVNAQLLASLSARPQLGQVTGATKVPQFVAATEVLLATLLDAAFDKIKTFAPDELPDARPPVSAGAAWLSVARAELAAGVTETTAPDRIRSYFGATDHGPVAAKLPAWCGAFAAYCVRTGGGEVPRGSAEAVSWKAWGSRSLPLGSHDVPVGAVVVLTPAPGTATSGHVGFFTGFSADGAKLELLGGNQSDAVRLSQFPVTRVAAIRVTGDGSTGAGAANRFDLSAAGVRKDRQKWGDLIVSRFRSAGYDKDQQLLTALANAIAESKLDPGATASGTEQSYGLFQCNRRFGLGVGYSISDLKDPETNIGIILQAARRCPAFGSASSLAAAMDAFVRYIERPLDVPGAIKARTKIAGLLV